MTLLYPTRLRRKEWGGVSPFPLPAWEWKSYYYFTFDVEDVTGSHYIVPKLEVLILTLRNWGSSELLQV